MVPATRLPRPSGACGEDSETIGPRNDIGGELRGPLSGRISKNPLDSSRQWPNQQSQTPVTHRLSLADALATLSGVVGGHRCSRHEVNTVPAAPTVRNAAKR